MIPARVELHSFVATAMWGIKHVLVVTAAAVAAAAAMSVTWPGLYKAHCRVGTLVLIYLSAV
jgi:hypothetical protein